MDETLLFYLKDFSLEIIIISLVIFVLTMFIKWPIKRATSKLAEEKRKALNTFIVFIPMVLSLLINVLYYGILNHVWLDSVVFESVATCYITSVVIYAVYSRVVIIFKGFKTQKETIEDQNIAQEVKNAAVQAKTIISPNTKLNSVIKQIEDLLSARNKIVSNIALKDVANLDEIDNKLELLNKQKLELQNKIEKSN